MSHRDMIVSVTLLSVCAHPESSAPGDVIYGDLAGDESLLGDLPPEGATAVWAERDVVRGRCAASDVIVGDDD